MAIKPTKKKPRLVFKDIIITRSTLKPVDMWCGKPSVCLERTDHVVGQACDPPTDLGPGCNPPTDLGPGCKAPTDLGPGCEAPTDLGPGCEAPTDVDGPIEPEQQHRWINLGMRSKILESLNFKEISREVELESLMNEFERGINTEEDLEIRKEALQLMEQSLKAASRKLNK